MPSATRRLDPGASILARVFAGLSVAAAVVSGTWATMQSPHSFKPYLVALLVAAPLGALAAGLATNGLRYVRSGEREDPAPQGDTSGWFVVPVFREYLALRNGALGALAVFFVVGFVAFVDYFGRAPRPSGGAVLVLLGWMALLVRLAWASVKRTWVARRLHDARLMIRPAYPVAGETLHVAFEQPVRTDLWVRAVDLTLVAERMTHRFVGRKQRFETRVIARQRLRLPVDARAWPAAPIHVEGAIEVSTEATEAPGFLSFWVDARTRMSGPDYVTRFPIGRRDDGEEGEDEGERDEEEEP